MGFAITVKAQTDMPLNVPSIGHGATINNATYRFTYAGFPVSHYGLGWYIESSEGPSSYISGYGGVRFFTAGNPRMSIKHNGNVGIGTETPMDKLSVNGKIRAQEIKVETANWPDYVFAKDYPLPSLQETERYIKDKGHLAGIPSAEEVNANGVDLGKMNAKLLQKIEELTLHLIDMKKENDQERSKQQEKTERQEKLIEQQQKDINELKSKFK
jgi:hypothetical protein